MTATQSNFSDASLSDFSSTLLRVGVGNNATAEEEVIVNLSSTSYDSDENRNLSSILSQIQDDGPAHGKTKKRENLFSRKAAEITPSASESANQSRGNLDSAQSTKAERTSVSEDQFLSSKDNKRSTWFQMSLIILVTVLATLTLFNINIRTSDLEQTVNSKNSVTRENIVDNSESLLPEIIKISESLMLVQQDLKNIKTDYSASGVKPAVVDQSVTENNPEVVGLKINVDALESEIISLKEKLKTTNDKLQSLSNIEVLSENKKLSSAVKNVVAHSGLVVNLASLSNESRAEELVNKLHADGLSPSIENVIIKNVNIYRISVSGFEDVDAAKSFIKSANKQYGMSGGWIRKS